MSLDYHLDPPHTVHFEHYNCNSYPKIMMQYLLKLISGASQGINDEALAHSVEVKGGRALIHLRLVYGPISPSQQRKMSLI